METTLSLLFKGNSSGAVTAVNELTEALERLGKAGGSLHVTTESVKKETAAVEKAITESAKKTEKIVEESDASKLRKARTASAERIALAEREVAEKKKTIAELKAVLDEELANDSLTEAKKLAISKKSIEAAAKLERERLAQVQSDSAEMRRLLASIREQEAADAEKASAKEKADTKKNLTETREQIMERIAMEERLVLEKSRTKEQLSLIYRDAIQMEEVTEKQRLSILQKAIKNDKAIEAERLALVSNAGAQQVAAKKKTDAQLLAETRRASAEKIALAEKEVVLEQRNRLSLQQVYEQEIQDASLTQAALLSIARKSVANKQAIQAIQSGTTPQDKVNLREYRTSSADRLRVHEAGLVSGSTSNDRMIALYQDATSDQRLTMTARASALTKMVELEKQIKQRKQSDDVKAAELEVSLGRKTRAELAQIYDGIASDLGRSIAERAEFARKAAAIRKSEEVSVEQANAKAKSQASTANAELRKEIREKIALIALDQEQGRKNREETAKEYAEMLQDTRLYYSERLSIARAMSKLIRDEEKATKSNDPMSRDANGFAAKHEQLRINGMKYSAYLQAGQTTAQFGRAMSYGVGMPLALGTGFSLREFGNFEKRQGGIETSLVLGGEKNFNRQKLDKTILSLATSDIGLPIEDIQDIALQGVQAGVGQEKLEGYIKSLYKLKLLIPDVGTDELAEKFNKLMVSSGNDLEMAAKKMQLESARLATIGTMSAAGSKEVLSASTRISGGISNLGGSTMLTYALAGAGTGAGIRPDAYSTQINKLSTMLLRSKESFKEKTGGDSALQVLAGLVYGGKDFGPGSVAQQKKLLQELEKDTDKTVLTIFEKLRSLQRGKGTSVAVYDELGIKGRDGVRSFFTLGNVQGDKTPTAFYNAALAVDGEKVEKQVQARQKQFLSEYQLTVNKFRKLAIDLGNAIIPSSKAIVAAVEAIAKGIEFLVSKFSSLPSWGKEAVIGLVAFSVAIGGITTAFGNMVSGASNAMLAVNKFNQFRLATDKMGFINNMVGLGVTTASTASATASQGSVALNASRIGTMMSLQPDSLKGMAAAERTTGGLLENLVALKGIGSIAIGISLGALAYAAIDKLFKMWTGHGATDGITEGIKAFTETREANAKLESIENSPQSKALENMNELGTDKKRLLSAISKSRGPQREFLISQLKIVEAEIRRNKTTLTGKPTEILSATEVTTGSTAEKTGRRFTAGTNPNARTAAIDSAQDRLNKIGARLAAAQEAVAGAYADIDLAYEKDKAVPGEKQKSTLKGLIEALAKVRLEMADATASMKIAQGLDASGKQTKGAAAGTYATLERAKAGRDNTKDILEFRKKMEAYDSEELEVRKKEIQAAKANLQEELKTLSLRLAGENDPLSQSVLTGLISGKQREIAKKELFINQLAAQQGKNPAAQALAGRIYSNDLAGIDVGERNSLDDIFNKAKREEIAGLEIQRKAYEEGTAEYKQLTEAIRAATESLRGRTESEKAATLAEIEAERIATAKNKARRRQAEFELNASMIDPSQESWMQFRKSARFEGAMAIEPNAVLLDQIINGNAPPGVGRDALFSKARSPQALRDYISGMNAEDRADELTQLMARVNLSVDSAAYSEEMGDSFSQSFIGQARRGVSLAVKDSDKAGVLKTLAALLSEGYQASTGLFGKTASINLETYLGTMSQLRDLSSPYGPKGVNVINDEMAKQVKAVVGVELAKTGDVPRTQRGQAIDAVEKYLNSLPRWSEIPTQLKEELERTFKDARKILESLDPRRIAARRAEGEIRGALVGAGRGMFERLFNPIEGTSQTIGFGATRQVTRGADQQWSEFWKEAGKAIKTSIAGGIWDGLVQPQLDSFVDRFSGALTGFLGQWQGTISNLLVGMSSLGAVLGAGGKRRQSGALIGGALGFLAGSLIPGLGNAAGAQIGASMGGAYASGGGLGGALTAGAGAYGGLNLKNLSRPGIGGSIRDLGDGTVVVGKSRAATVTGGPQVNLVMNIRNEDKSSAEFYNEGMIGSLERALVL